MKQHWPFAILAAIALALIMTNLGSDYLWADEGDTAVLARNILKFGVPKSWDGVSFIDSDKGSRTNSDLVMVSHPWLQYYVAAASMLAFGKNAFAARFPFALAGWMSILLVYFFVRRIARSNAAGFCAAALMVSSVQFLLYCRQSRYYTLSMLLTCALLWVFFEMKSWRACVFFALAAILLFHSFPFSAVPVGVLAVLTLFYRPLVPQRRWIWTAVPLVALMTVPWLALARSGYISNTDKLQSLAVFIARVAQYVIECSSVTPLLGSLALILIYLWQSKRRSANADFLLRPNEKTLLVITFATIACFGLALASTKSCYAIWLLGIRYTAAVAPMIAMITGVLIANVTRNRLSFWLPLLLLFAFTLLPQPTAWMFWGERAAMFGPNEFVEMHVPVRTIDRFLRREQMLFVRDLFQKNPGTVAETCRFLQAHAQPSDVAIVNYEYEPVYFHTGLAQALTILPSYPIYEAARAHGLPEYTFDVDHARWIVWRPAWDSGEGYSPADLSERVSAGGGSVQEVATLKETLWENRENIHFHRFSGETYLFPWFPRGMSDTTPQDFPNAVIYRVDWPAGIR